MRLSCHGRMQVQGAHLPVKYKKGKYTAMEADDATIAPMPNERMYWAPLMSVAYLNGTKKLPAETPTMLAQSTPNRKRPR